MNRILKEIKKIIDSNIELYLPHVKISDLENDGEIYYMNGKDGTEFDWYVNDKLPPFMVFYNDEANLGAIKLLLYNDGGIVVNIYDEKGKKLIKEVHTCLDANKKITEEGWKAGYMERNKPFNEEDSGWAFFAGNEDDKYISDYRNIELISVGNVWQQLDSDILKYIDMPIGTKLIRSSSETFEIDKNDKEIFMVKR